jgi:opacity protein-like surface antigen
MFGRPVGAVEAGVRWKRLLPIVTLACLAAVGPASAEVFIDPYIGGAFTEKNDLDISPPLGSRVTVRDVTFDASFATGLRVGYWLPFALGPLNFGFGVDVSYFSPDISAQTRDFCTGFCVSRNFADFDLLAWTIGFDAMLRYPLLKSADFPNGRLQPYFTIGPAVFVAHAEDNGNFTPSNQDDTDASVGVKLGLGVTWLFTRNIGIFGEYRYTHFSPEFTFNDPGGNAKLSTDINTHYVIVGASFRF